jgi:glucose-6-phosphate 1-dehydrogenase
VLFGAGGDLSRRLIVPALFNLYLDGQLPSRFRLLGIDRQDSNATALAESFRQGVVDYSRRGEAVANDWATFAAMVDYQRMDLTDPADRGVGTLPGQATAGGVAALV